MPSSQILSSSNLANQSNVANKPPPPTKLPPPPPPPPKNPPPPPPPPPRNSSQLASQSSSLSSNQLTPVAAQPVVGSSNTTTITTTNNTNTNGLNNGSSMNSLNSAGRCGHFQHHPPPPPPPPPPTTTNSANQRAFTRHTECGGSRASVSSHGSLQHNHSHVHSHNPNSNGNNSTCGFVPNNVCAGHQAGSGGTWSGSSIQYNYPSSMSDSGSCNLTSNNYNIENRNPCQSINRNGAGYCSSGGGAGGGPHHLHSAINKCPPNQSIITNVGSLRTTNSSMNNGGGANINNGQTTILNNRNTSSCYNQDSASLSSNQPVASDGYCHNANGGEPDRVGSSYPHNHHHHHNLHTVQLSSSSSISSVPPVDSSIHRCNLSSVGNSTIHPNAPSIISSSSSNHHSHRANIGTGCTHHHSPQCCHHHHHQQHQQQQQQQPGPHTVCTSHGCPHQSDTNNLQHNRIETNGTPLRACPPPSHHSSVHHHFAQGEQQPQFNSNLRPSDHVPPVNGSGSGGDSLISTAHTHNLSNSSTTTHTSNVAVRHQHQFHRPILSRGGRSSSSQQYEQYGLSSAASTSSATASLSSYQPAASYDDLVPLYPTSRIHQPLPPPPLPPAKSQPNSPAHQMFLTSNHSIINPNAFIANYNHAPQQQQQQQQLQQQQQQVSGALPSPPPPPPPPPPSHLQTTPTTTIQHQIIFNQTLPPLPPRPLSPNASSCSTQITTVRTSSSPVSQPVTRVTSQAGVQIPLPTSDIPPPLPPPLNSATVNGSSRATMTATTATTQPLINTTMTRIQNVNSSDSNNNQSASSTNPVTNLLNLNYTRGGIMTEAERKTEALTRQVEYEIEQQQNAGQPHGICKKCGHKVMPAQEACKAMNQIYHANCFVCCECERTLLNKVFYPVGDKVYCEEDYKYIGHMQSLERCAECSQPIFDMILPAIGKSYHPKCFKCCVCGLCLDGVPFTIDKKNKIYCVKDYHNLYSPKCARCGKSISPIDGTDETVRVVSMDKDYHIDCYCCEDCGLQLTDEEPSRSYPLENSLLCHHCHINRLSKMQAALSLR